MVSRGYSLWLMPKGRAYDKFSGLIKKLAAENNSPVFEPHITILDATMLPEDEIIRRTEKLVHGQKTFTITLQNIDYQDYFFRTLFVRAKITNQLLLLRKKVAEVFEMDLPPYMPHLSILYGDFPQVVKNKIIENIGRDQTTSFELRSVILMKGGEIDKWRIIKQFPFK